MYGFIWFLLVIEWIFMNKEWLFIFIFVRENYFGVVVKKYWGIIKFVLNMVSFVYKNIKIVKFYEVLYMLNGLVVNKLNLYKFILFD